MSVPTVFEARQDQALRELFIKAHLPFVIHTTSSVIGRYISVENDEAFSVALEGFNQAIDTYKPEISKFETYATTVIRNRIYDFIRQEKKHSQNVALDEQIASQLVMDEPEDNLRIEIAEYSTILKRFGLSFEELADISPTHKDTRQRAVKVGMSASTFEAIVTEIYRILKLPVNLVLKFVGSTRRFVYLHRHYILSVTLIFTEDLKALQNWIMETLKNGGGLEK